MAGPGPGPAAGPWPAPAGDPGRLRTGTGQAVAAEVAAAQATGRVPALATAVVREGRLIHVATAGDPVGPQVQFRIGPVTQTITAVLLLQLRDQGRLSLDDLLYRHLPGTAVGAVTLRQLLGHASGLPREPDGPDGRGWRAPGPELAGLLAGVAPDQLPQPPGGHRHSNLGYALLGAVLRRVTGQDWPELFDQRLRQPLGLHRTTYHPQEPFVRGYLVHPWHGTLREEPRPDSRAMAPAGQLWSTLADLGRWAGFLADPDPAVLAPATLAQMCAPVAICDPEHWRTGHGLGLTLWRDGDRIYAGQAGSMPGYLAGLVVHRPSRTGVVALANAGTLHGGSIGRLGVRLLTAVLDREPAPPRPWRPAGPPPAEVGPLLGRWWWLGREHEASWDAGAAELVITPLTGEPGQPPARFTAGPADRWHGTAGGTAGEALAVRRDPAGRVAGLAVAGRLLTRDPEPAGPKPADLRLLG
jgi:CubicO group peptidase (beta-lactamase class C family)